MARKNPIPVPARVYRTAELRSLGVSAQRLRASDVRRVARGYVIHPDYTFDPFDYRTRCHAVAETLQEQFFVSHRSAAALWGIPAPVVPRGRVDVSSFSPLRAPQHRLIDGHRVRNGSVEWAVIDGITTPSPADIWCQLAAVATLEDLVAAGDFLISGTRIVHSTLRDQDSSVRSGATRTSALCTPDELETARRRHRRTRGSPLRLRAIHLLRSPVDSVPESLLRLAILASGLPEPQVNCPVVTRHRVLHADLGYPELRIAIEYEGKHHFAGPAQVEFDLRRRRAMIDAGWTVLQAVDADIDAPADFIDSLTRAIEAALAAATSALS